MINTFRRIWNISSKRHGSLVKALALSFLRSVFGVTQLLAILLGIGVLTGEMEPMNGVLWIGGLCLVCVAGNFLTSYFEQTSTLETGFYMTADKRVDIGGLLRRLPLGFFSEASTGRLCASLTSTLTGVETASTMVVVNVVSGLFNAVVFFLFLLFFEWRIGLLAGAGMLCYLLLVNYQMKLSRRQGPALQKAQTGLAEAALTFLQGIRVTKAFRFRSGDENLKKAIRESCDANLRLTNRSMPSQFGAGLCIALFESAILVGSLWLCFRGGEPELARSIVLMLISFMVYASLNQAGSMLSMIGLLDAGLAEVEEIEKARELPRHQPAEKAQSNEIVFDHVSFSYGEREVLHDISATVAPQSLTALIGPSGSGKTSLCQLIPRFRDVNQGKITIGGADIRSMDPEALMAKISMVFQKVYLFEDTVLNNIRFGRPDASLEEVRAAAKAARCDDFIMALPQGYDTVLREGGSTLSGGEKQRISIARAMLKDAPIIILDEATSALDAENEHEILAAIDELTRNKTVIMIAHRLKSVRRADHIIALRDGRIVQEGTHETLKDVPGLYADFLASRDEAEGWQLGN